VRSNGWQRFGSSLASSSFVACVCALSMVACTKAASDDGNNDMGFAAAGMGAGAAGTLGGGMAGVTGAGVGGGAGVGAAGTDTALAGTGTAGTTAGVGTAGTTAGMGTAGTTAGMGEAGTTAGTGEAGTTAGTGEAGTTAGTGSEWVDKGMGDGKDVVTIGDSYMNLDNIDGIQQSLERISGRDYRNYGAPATQVLDGVIPRQYTRAASEGPIKTVVMTGGGNDILIGNILCTVNWTSACNKTVDDVHAAIHEMRDEMLADGVEDVLIVMYGYATNATLRPGLEYSMELMPESCKTTDMPRCHYTDNRTELMGKIRADGIHPTREGYDIIAKKAWDLMQERGLRR